MKFVYRCRVVACSVYCVTHRHFLGLSQLLGLLGVLGLRDIERILPRAGGFQYHPHRRRIHPQDLTSYLKVHEAGENPVVIRKKI